MSWRLRVVHSTGFAYHSPVTSSYNEARLTPRSDARQNVIVNRVGAPIPGDRVRDLIASRIPVAALHLLPEETTTCRSASWDGALLAEAAPRSALRRGIRDIAVQSALLQAPTIE